MTLSIRVKIMALAFAVLLLSFATYLAAGRSLILKDKSSYIYDYNLSLVHEVGTDLNSQVDQLYAISQSLALVLSTGPENDKLVNAFYDRNKSLLPGDGLLVASPQNNETFAIPVTFPSEDPALRAVFSSQNWRPLDFEKSPVLVGHAVDGKLPFGFRALAGPDKPLVVFALLEIRHALLSQYGENVRIEVLGPGGALVQFGSPYDLPVPDEEIERFRASLFSKPFDSGAQDVKLGNSDFLASYVKVRKLPIIVLGMISKAQAFTAAETLVRQTLLLGLGILFFAIAFVLFFSEGITTRLKELWLATQRVGEGDFTTPVTLANGRMGTKDEITDLSLSFNKMAGRIDELMKETSIKARMAAELETAQTVQSRFLPSSDYRSDNLEIAGKAIPATECGGDWWQYRQIGPYLIVAIGDVTGHGVSSALVTAAAHGVFCVTVAKQEKDYTANGARPDLGELLSKLNEAVCAAGGEIAAMTLLISMIDTRSGEMFTCNASHRPPYIYSPNRVVAGNCTSAFRVVQGGKMPQLGLQKNIEITVTPFQLAPGDLVIWYTDGLLECENPEGSPLRRTELLRLIATLHGKEGSDARGLCGGLVDHFVNFLGKNASNPDDDTTIVVARISKDARLLSDVPDRKAS